MNLSGIRHFENFAPKIGIWVQIHFKIIETHNESNFDIWQQTKSMSGTSVMILTWKRES